MDLASAIALPFAATFLLLFILFTAYFSLCKLHRHCHDGVEHGQSSDIDVSLTKTKHPVTRRFKPKEIDSITTSIVIGEGGSSTVYLANLPDSSLAAVKVHNSSHRLHRAFRQELDALLRVNHDHIIRLLGYCDEKQEGVLVFEYVPNGTLYDYLYNRNGLLLSWSKRTSILYSIATVLDYLHEGCDLQIIHGDVKSANILLDEGLAPKLCDFGFARMGFSATVTRSADQMMGSLGYVDPHYLKTGMISKKSDVYSFGVMVLELVTGTEAFDADAEEERLLTAVIRSTLNVNDRRSVLQIVDAKLGNEYEADEVLTMTEIAVKCIAEQPVLRPSMAEVVKIMKEKVNLVTTKDKLIM